MRRRLFTQVYLSFLFVSLLTLLASGIAIRWAVYRTLEVPRAVQTAATLVLETLPDPRSAPVEFRQSLGRYAQQLGVHVSVWSASGALLGRVGDRLPSPPAGCSQTWVRSSSGDLGLCVQLPEGEWVAIAGVDDSARDLALRGGGVFFAIFGTIALGCYPLTRRITRRLEALQEGVEALGRGELDRRVTVEGQDEVALVAAAFNDSADRVAALVSRQRRVLAHASHELRSPLARLRLALALLDDAESAEARADALAQATDEIHELDDLIEDVLLASRLRGGVAVPRCRELVDLVELAASLVERHSASLLPAPGPVWVEGDARLLERAVGNLLSNARLHGAPPIELGVQQDDSHARLHVLDRGHGIAESDRERIFEPFFRPEGHREGDPGVGLGLSLVEEIVRHHGGEVSCSARPDGGTRFTLALPRAPTPPA